MQIGPRTLARALEVKSRIDTVTAELQQCDGVAGVDLDTRPNEVVVGSGSGVTIPAQYTYKDEVLGAQVSIDPATRKPTRAAIDCAQYYDSSYGRSAEDVLHYGVTLKDGVLTYTQKRDDHGCTNNTMETIRVDAATGNVLSYRAKEYAETFPQALKEVFTSFPGLFLVGTAALLCGAPGTLGGVLLGPVGGLIGGGATAIGLAYYKTRPWNPQLPRNNE